MSERDENVEIIEKAENEESLQEISDNSRDIEELQYQYEEKLSMIKSLGYEESFIQYNENEGKMLPKVIVICKEKDMPVGTYTLDGGFEINDLSENKLPQLFADIEKQIREQEEASKENDEKVPEIEENEGKKQDTEKQEVKDEKQENEGELTKEEIQKQLGDKYVVAEVIVDEEISRALIGSEGFTGNPMIAFNKEEKKFEIVGNKGGKLEKAKLPTMPASTGKVKRYNHDGTIINEEKGNVSDELLLINGGKDGIELGVSDYGEIILNKQLNVNDINQESRVSVPIDTKQKVPTTKEIEEMKVQSNETNEVSKKLDEMERDKLISREERRTLEKKFATDGKTPEENLEDAKKIEQEKLKQEEKNKDEDELEGYDPRDPNYISEERLMRERGLNN